MKSRKECWFWLVCNVKWIVLMMTKFLTISKTEVKDWMVSDAMFGIWCDDCRIEYWCCEAGSARSQRCQHLSMIGIVGSRPVKMSRLSVSPPSPPPPPSSHHPVCLSVFTIKLGINKTVCRPQCGRICCRDVFCLLSNSCDITAGLFSPYTLN